MYVHVDCMHIHVHVHSQSNSVDFQNRTGGGGGGGRGGRVQCNVHVYGLKGEEKEGQLAIGKRKGMKRRSFGLTIFSEIVKRGELSHTRPIEVEHHQRRQTKPHRPYNYDIIMTLINNHITRTPTRT